MMRALILTACLLSCAVSVSAQENPSPGELAAAREFLEVSRTNANWVLTLQAMLEGQMGSELPPDVQTMMKQFFAEHFSAEVMEPGFIRLYTELFTEDELRAFTAFYRTPAGQRMAELTPQIDVRSSELSMEAMEVAMPALMEMIAEAMEKEEAQGARGNSPRS